MKRQMIIDDENKPLISLEENGDIVFYIAVHINPEIEWLIIHKDHTFDCWDGNNLTDTRKLLLKFNDWLQVRGYRVMNEKTQKES